MRRSLNPGMSEAEKRKFETLMSKMSRDIPPLSVRDEASLARIEKDLERRAFAKLNPRQDYRNSWALFKDPADIAGVFFCAGVAVGCLVAAIVWSL